MCIRDSLNVVTDTSPQLGGNLDANSKNILFGDTSGSSNNRLKFGAGPDLEISHNGTDSIIQDAGTGDLKIGGSIVRLTNSAINENMLVATENGAVELYHDNVKTAWTHASGFNIKGKTTSDNTELIITGNEGQAASILMSADDGDDNADHWRMYSNADNSFTLNSYAGGSYQSILKGTSSRSIELNYQGSKKLETTSSGVEIHNDLLLDGTANLGNIIRTNYDGGGHMYHKNNSQGANYSSHFQTYLSSDEGGTTQTHLHYYHGGYCELLHQGNSSVRTRSGGGVLFRNGASTIGTFSPSGLAFGTDTAAANSIHDYEYGSWTPVYAASGGNYGTLTYSVQTGQYVKIGRLVFVQFYINYTFGSVGGNFRIGGLPYSANSYGTGSVMMNNHVTDNDKWYVLHTSNDSYLYLYGTESNTVWSSAAADSSAGIIGSCTYYTTT